MRSLAFPLVDQSASGCQSGQWGKFGQSGHEKDRVKAGQLGTRQDSQEMSPLNPYPH